MCFLQSKFLFHGTLIPSVVYLILYMHVFSYFFFNVHVVCLIFFPLYFPQSPLRHFQCGVCNPILSFTCIFPTYWIPVPWDSPTFMCVIPYFPLYFPWDIASVIHVYVIPYFLLYFPTEQTPVPWDIPSVMCVIHFPLYFPTEQTPVPWDIPRVVCVIPYCPFYFPTEWTPVPWVVPATVCVIQYSKTVPATPSGPGTAATCKPARQTAAATANAALVRGGVCVSQDLKVSRPSLKALTFADV